MQDLNIVVLQKVDQATIDKIEFSSKDPQTSNFSFIHSLKTLGNATKQSVLLFATLLTEKMDSIFHKNLKPDNMQHKNLRALSLL